MSWSKMISMELDDEDILDAIMPFPMPDKPKYPYGLRICLTEKELEKLDLEADCNVGDIIDLRAFARVTSVSSNEMENGKCCCRVELTLEELAVENEMSEAGGD